MPSPQTLSEADRRIVAAWAADCASGCSGRSKPKLLATTAPVRRSRGHDTVAEEIRWQLEHMSEAVGAALAQLPPVGQNRNGPLGPGLLASGVLGSIVRDLQAGLTQLEQPETRNPAARGASR